MNMEKVATVQRIVTQVARDSGMPAKINCPVAVWNNTTGLIGVSINSPKRMGEQNCMMTASFVIAPGDNELKITQKASVALQAIRNGIQCKVRPIAAKQEAA